MVGLSRRNRRAAALVSMVVLASCLGWAGWAMAADASTTAPATAPSPELPQIPDHAFNLADFGGVGDGKTINTAAFTKALAAVTAAGGGKLVVPKGEFLTLPINLVSHLDLHLEDGAKIQFPADLKAYSAIDALLPRPDSLAKMDGGNSSLLYGDTLTDVAITGTGTIDGGGQAWWGSRGKTTAVGPIHGRPKMIILTHSQRIHLDGVTLANSPMWFFVPVQCENVTIENVKINAPQHSPNTDAIDPTASTDVLIRNCDLDEGDDNVAMKALGGPCSNIWIENVHSKHGHGISIGSETYGGVHDVTVQNCTFDGGDNGIRIKSARDRGNQLYNFSFSNITMDNVTNPIVIDMYYSGGHTRQEQPVTPTTPFLKNVQISNVTIKNSRNAGRILGLPEAPATGIVLSHVTIDAMTGMTVQDVKGCVFDDVKINVERGEPIMKTFSDLTVK